LGLLDGIEARGQIFVLATTNRPEHVDPALRRPGRFDSCSSSAIRLSVAARGAHPEEALSALTDRGPSELPPTRSRLSLGDDFPDTKGQDVSVPLRYPRPSALG